MSDSNQNLCKVCNANSTIVVLDSSIKYDTCMICYFVDVNNNSNRVSPASKFELCKSE